LDLRERHALLQSAGLEVLENSHAILRTTPEQGWKSVVNMEVSPSARIPEDAEDSLRQADRECEHWARLHDMFAQDGSFLIKRQS